MMTSEVSLYDTYLEISTRIFTNMQFMVSAVEEDLRIRAEKDLQGEKKPPASQRQDKTVCGKKGVGTCAEYRESLQGDF